MGGASRLGHRAPDGTSIASGAAGMHDSARWRGSNSPAASASTSCARCGSSCTIITRSVSRVQPFVDDETSWAARRRSYVETFDGGGFALVADDDDGLAGYAMVRIHEGRTTRGRSRTATARCWTILVTERARGRGLGSALLDEVDAELARRGIRDLMIGVMEGNDDARRLYERRGLVPGWLQLYRLAAAER